MYVPQQNEEPELNQAVLYEDLTELIKIFKAILSSCESISGYISRGEQCEQQVMFLRRVLDGKQKVVNRYHYEVHEQSPHKNTFFRFVSRINETIELYKNRTYKHNLYGKFQQFVCKLENVVKSYMTYRNIGKIFAKILSHAHKYCTNLQSISKTFGKEEIDHTFHQEAKESSQFQQETHTKNIQFNNTQTNFHKVMTGLNKRFKTMSCLDIDYNSFKGGYYLAKNQKNDLFKDMFFRNSQIYRLINIYSKQFEDYLKRRDRQIVRKNRFKQEKNMKNAHSLGFKTYNQFNKTVEVTKILQTEEDSQQALKRDSMPQIVQSTKLKKEKETLNTESNFMQVNSRKTSCRISNIYLTLNKGHLKTENAPNKFTKNNIREKNKYYSILNSHKFSLKSSKFSEAEVTGNRPILEIRQLDYKNMQSKFQQFTNNNESFIKTNNDTIKPLTQSKHKEQTVTSRRSIRISCVSKKNSFNTSVIRTQLAQKGEDFGIVEHQMLQQQLLH